MVQPIGVDMVLCCVRLRFEKSSPRWRIVGRKGKILLKEFFKLCWRLAKYRCNQLCRIRERVGRIDVGLHRMNKASQLGYGLVD